MAFQEGQVPGPGRDSYLDDEAFRRQFVDLVRTGLPRRHARAKMRVTSESFRNWEKRAAAGDEPYVSFFLELEVAEADLFHGIEALWQKQMPDDWRAAEAFLKRHPAFREDMGDRSTTEITGANGAPLQVVLTGEEEAAL